MPFIQLLHSGNSQKTWPLLLRWGFLALLLVAELLGLSVRFDTAVLEADTTGWAQLVGNTAPAFLRIALAFVAAFLLSLAPRLKAIALEAQQRAQAHRWGRWLLSHLLAYGAFYWITLAVFSGAESGGNLSGGLLAVWAGLGFANVCLWLLAIASFGFWAGLLAGEWQSLIIAFLAGTAAWLGGLLAQEFWEPLAAGTFWLTSHLLELIYADALYDASRYVLGTPGFRVQISPQCSGYEGIGLVTVFLALYLWLFRAEIRFPHAFLLFPIGALAIWLANALRITLLIALGTSFSREVALGGFHSQAGWIAFIVIALGLILAARRLHLFAKTGHIAVTERSSVTTALLVPLMVLMGVIMLTSALTSGFDRFYPLRVVATTAALWHFRRVYLCWEWRSCWQAIAIGTAVFAMWMLLEPGVDSGKTVLGKAMVTLPEGEKALWLAFRVAGSVLVVPFVEELAFRGYLLRRLAGQDDDDLHPGRFAWLPFMVSSVAFGLLHTRVLAGTLAGMAYALAYYRRGKLADAVAAHMVTNGLIALFVLVFGEWSLWA
ncbi:MAG: exosortase E/protease, VPEID-CTERM system [Methylobacter sp.]